MAGECGSWVHFRTAPTKLETPETLPLAAHCGAFLALEKHSAVALWILGVAASGPAPSFFWKAGCDEPLQCRVAGGRISSERP